MIDYPLSPLANQSLNWAWIGYRSLSLSMKGLASAAASPLRWMAAFWSRPCCGRAFVSLTDGFGLLNGLQEIVTDLTRRCCWLAASAANADSCREPGASFKHPEFPAGVTGCPQKQLQCHSLNNFMLQMCPWAGRLIPNHWRSSVVKHPLWSWAASAGSE